MMLAYIVSRFPVLTETFVLREILELQVLNWPIDVFALRHMRQSVAHSAARRLEEHVHFPDLRQAFARSVHLARNDPESWARLVAMIVSAHRSDARVLSRSLLVLPVAVAWADEMRALGVRHVHAHFGTYPALAALLAAELQGIGFSFTVHAHDLFADNLMLAEKARRASFVITISEFNRARLLDLLGPNWSNRVHVIHCGVNPREFPFHPTRNDAHPRSLVCVAALRDYKGVHDLIEACRLLCNALPAQSFVCHIVGEGPCRGALEKQIHTSGLSECVRLMGARTTTQVIELLARSDTFVLPSVVARNGYMDGIPVALMEAMASGVPVIASRLSGIPELVRDEDTGLLVPPGRPDAIRNAVLRCWSQPALVASVAARARALVEREYDVRENTRTLASLFARQLCTYTSEPTSRKRHASSASG